MTTAEGNIAVPVVRVEGLKFMGVTVRDHLVAVHNLPENANVDGLLGTDAMTGLGVRIDFATNELEVTQANLR